MVASAGQLMDGAVTSALVRVKLQEVELPAASVAVSVTVVVPTPVSTVPTAGDWVTTIEPAALQLSTTVATPV
jgi:hypothetical protein